MNKPGLGLTGYAVPDKVTLGRLLSLVWLTAVACGSDIGTHPHLLEHPNRHVIEPGQVYTMVFAENIDQDAVGHQWYADDLAGSPLAFMERTPIVIKADDYGAALNQNSARFIEALDVFGAFVSLGIVTSKLTDSDEINRVYRELDANGFEAWFHGHTHNLSGAESEFSGVGRDQQKLSFTAGLDLGREVLGIDFHTFGAPGNAIDEQTGVALRAFPQLVVWLFGESQAAGLGDADVAVFPRIINLERVVGEVASPSVFSATLDGIVDLDEPADVLTLQVHPNSFDEADFERVETIFTDIMRRDLFRYTAPFELWKWRQDQRRIIITKTGELSYDLDLSAANFDHIIEFDPNGPNPVTFE